jgi:predicted DNA-binding transcriptional regulator YafY
MGHATAVQSAERLNRAREIVADAETLPAAVEQMMRESGISRRQAYRYVEQARRLPAPVAVPDVRIPITLKVSQGLVRALHAHARATGLSLSEIVNRALLAVLPARSRRG